MRSSDSLHHRRSEVCASLPWWRRPLLQFAVGGLLLFAVDRLWRDEATVSGRRDARVVIDARRIAELRREHQRRFGAPPSEDQLASLIDAEIADELLYREARALGLDRDDASIHWRVLQKMRFVSDDPGRSDKELIREGLHLGLDRDDLVIRRILAQKMRLVAQLPARSEPIDPADLAAFFAANRELYRRPPRVSLTHVFLSRERRGERAKEDARKLLHRLRDESVPPDEVGSLGDAFPLERRPRAQSERQLASLLGPEFAARVMQLEPGRWSGPVPSAYGWHVVYVEERSAARDPSLEEIRSQVEQRLRAERAERFAEAFVRDLRSRYEVEIEAPFEHPESRGAGGAAPGGPPGDRVAPTGELQGLRRGAAGARDRASRCDSDGRVVGRSARRCAHRSSRVALAAGKPAGPRYGSRRSTRAPT